MNIYKKSWNAPENKPDIRELSRILYCIKVLPFNTTWLFYKPRKITIYYDDSTVHIAVGGISVTSQLWKVSVNHKTLLINIYKKMGEKGIKYKIYPRTLNGS